MECKEHSNSAQTESGAKGGSDIVWWWLLITRCHSLFDGRAFVENVSNR